MTYLQSNRRDRRTLMSALVAVALAAVLLLGCSADAMVDRQQRAARSCERLLANDHRSGVCHDGNQRLVVGATNQPVRIGRLELSAEKTEYSSFIAGDEEIPDQRPKGRLAVIRMHVANRGRTRLSISKVLAYGIRLYAAKRILRPKLTASVLALYEDDEDARVEYVAAGADQAFYVVFDVDAREQRSLAKKTATIHFVALTELSRKRNVVESASRVAVVRVPKP